MSDEQTAGEPVACRCGKCLGLDDVDLSDIPHPRPRVGVTVTPMYDHPSGKGATEAQIEAVARSFYGTFYPCDRLWADCPDDIRGWWLDAASDALTAALTAASEVQP